MSAPVAAGAPHLVLLATRTIGPRHVRHTLADALVRWAPTSIHPFTRDDALRLLTGDAEELAA